MTASLQPRPTTYKGVHMRSRLEAVHAQWLDCHAIRWAYEPECFADETGQYLPDFELLSDHPGRDFVEVKPNAEAAQQSLPNMHRILSTHPDALLFAMVNVGDHRQPHFRVAAGCTPTNPCGQCSFRPEPETNP